MKRYLEKKIIKYVIATLGNPTLYLKKKWGSPEYSFVEDIEIATKGIKKSVMEEVLKYYYIETRLNTELVIVPIEITYEIINEEELT